MNDDWSRCSICFEDYSSAHRPTTFVCGHSTCIDHVIGTGGLRHCPICRHVLKPNDTYHVSYSLEEASRLFQLIKNTIDWSTIKFPSPLPVNDAQNTTSEMIHRDEVYARQLQAELNRGNTNGAQQRTEVPRQTQPLPSQPTRGGDPATPVINQSTGFLKNCTHRCDLISTRQCCTCSDRRPHRPGGYEAYVDGVGIVNQAARNEYYCPTCKR